MHTMLRMILEIVEGCKDLEEAKEKIRALLKNKQSSNRKTRTSGTCRSSLQKQ
ncbi:MAG: hypothetical protein ACOYIO_00585 [Eubacteriales bacterium]